jgi:hypothetical protein
MEKAITYFDRRSESDTEETLRIAKDRALELNITQVVLASTHGTTALRAAAIFEGTGVDIIAVSISPSFDDVGWTMTSEERDRVEKAGVRVLTSLHALADGVAEGFFGENTPGTLVADTLRMFSQGMKVSVEISIMALESGLIEPGSEVIALGGTDQGVDTAVVIRPAYARKVKDFRVCEILCKPRIA